jgi:hypothetical protein
VPALDGLGDVSTIIGGFAGLESLPVLYTIDLFSQVAPAAWSLRIVPDLDMFGGVQLLAGPPGHMQPLFELMPDFPDFWAAHFDGDGGVNVDVDEGDNVSNASTNTGPFESDEDLDADPLNEMD